MLQNWSSSKGVISLMPTLLWLYWWQRLRIQRNLQLLGNIVYAKFPRIYFFMIFAKTTLCLNMYLIVKGHLWRED